jgi:esterase/lipase superfamily enzyme
VEFVKNIAPLIPEVAKRITLYASSRDRALIAANELYAYPRAGQSGEDLVLVKGIETVDASEHDTDLLGHSLFANSRPVVDDIARVLCDHFSPQKRKLLAAEKLGFRYWKFGTSSPGPPP